MATVTGFTAERMLVIENETVVDGEVQGDNLILSRRDGITIDAGNVRGPVGPVGPVGPIGSVNDVSASAVYSPRVFPNKAAIDGWTTAPNGSIALAVDNAIMWEKDVNGWFIVNNSRIFTDIAERDTRWINPPNGSYCQAPVGTEFVRSAGVWVDINWKNPRGYIGTIRGPASDISASNPIWSAGTFPVIANRRYRASGFVRTGNPAGGANSLRFIGWSEVPYNMIDERNNAAGEGMSGWGIAFLNATATGNSPALQFQYISGATGKILGNSGIIVCEDIGGY
jgi:hypothetical protein